MNRKKRIAWDLPADLQRLPRWADIPVLLYNIWATLDEIAEADRRREAEAKRAASRYKNGIVLNMNGTAKR